MGKLREGRAGTGDAGHYQNDPQRYLTWYDECSGVGMTNNELALWNARTIRLVTSLPTEIRPPSLQASITN